MPTVLACDLGGTSFRAAAVDGAGTVLARAEHANPRVADRNQTIAAIEAVIEDVRAGLAEAPVAAGVAIAGITNGETGIYVAGANMPGLRNTPLAALLGERIGLPVTIENDANAAALAEFRYGAGQGVPHLFHATLGTGIGGGIVIDGRLYRGHQGFTGEIGHVVVEMSGPECGCGARGCVEAFVSGAAFTRRARGLLANGRAPRLAEIVGTREPEGRDMYEAAVAGDQSCEAEIRHAGHVLGVGLAGALTLLDPDRMTLSGGLLAMGEMLLGPMEAAIRAKPYSAARSIDIRHSTLDDDSGLLGAAAVAWAKHSETGAG
jgi:glucokinase